VPAGGKSRDLDRRVDHDQLLEFDFRHVDWWRECSEALAAPWKESTDRRIEDSRMKLHGSGPVAREREAPGFMAGGGEMGARMRSYDWSTHPLGCADSWPQALRTAIRVILTTGHPMYIWWGGELFCFYNDAFRQSIGPERHPSSLGQPGREVWEEIWPIIGPQIDQVMSGGRPTWNENHLVPITRSGRLEDVYWTYSYGPIDDASASNGVGGVLVVCTETTQHVMAARRLAVERERQRLMLQQMPGFAALLAGPEHRFEYVNDAYREIAGDRDFVGRSVRDVFPDIAGQGFYELLDKVYATGEPFAARAMPISLDRPERVRAIDLLYQPIRDDAGHVTGIFVGGYDITERSRAEAELKATAERLQLATENAEIGFWDVDPVHDILTWPARTKAMFGISPDVPVSMRDFYDGLHPDDREATSAAYAAAADPDRRALYDVEYRTVGKEDGLVRWVAAKGRAVFDAAQRSVRVAGTAVDITSRKRAEEQLRALKETLETRVVERTAELESAHEQLRQSQKLEAMGSLTGGVAHDFNNLLTPIVGALDMLQRRGIGGEREQRLVSVAAQSAERAKTLVQRLLAFSRRQPLQPIPVDLGALVENMAGLVSSTTGPQIRVAVDVANDLPRARADPNQLEMALLNLSVNARDAMPDGGTLRISASAETVRAGQKSGLKAGGYICLSVADTGVGMDDATLARAVEPFFSTKGFGKGTGLGLSMVHGLASQLGGMLTIKSKLGLGTNIELWLPQTDEGGEASVAVTETEPMRGRGLALLVDDEAAVRLSTGEMLAELGYGVVEADSAEEALRIIGNGARVHLVITDHLMPGMTGIDLAHAIRERHPDIALLILSGYADVEGVAPDLPRLTKPFRKDQLAASLAGLYSSAGEQPT
jgi:PAS domain S-box-containing protein